MEKFQLSILFKIIGIGSASGLWYQNDLLYIISDNSTFLYEYSLSQQELKKIALVDYPAENIPKKDKPDFESITNHDGNLFIVGSGSTDKRNLSYKYSKTLSKKDKIDQTGLYRKIKQQLNFRDDELNIEGFIFHKNYLFLFQRGNGSQGKNGIISVYNNQYESEISFTVVDLPKIKDVAATFTDAMLTDDKIYFLASAENTTSTYLDGEVLGSLFGIIDLKTMKLEKCFEISDKHKFEGLTLFYETNTKMEFLLCEDADSDVMETNIFKLTLDKTQ